MVNATMEELLWRGVYISDWPDDWRLGVVYPSLGSIVIGLCWGWVAHSTHSLRLPWVSHAVTDSSGLRNALFFLPS